MPDFVKKYEGERLSAQHRMKRQPAVDRDDRLVTKLQRLGIDDRKIQLKLESQFGECLAEIVQQHCQQVFAIGPPGLEHFLF